MYMKATAEHWRGINAPHISLQRTLEKLHVLAKLQVFESFAVFSRFYPCLNIQI